MDHQRSFSLLGPGKRVEGETVGVSSSEEVLPTHRLGMGGLLRAGDSPLGAETIPSQLLTDEAHRGSWPG